MSLVQKEYRRRGSIQMHHDSDRKTPINVKSIYTDLGSWRDNLQKQWRSDAWSIPALVGILCITAGVVLPIIVHKELIVTRHDSLLKGVGICYCMVGVALVILSFVLYRRKRVQNRERPMRHHRSENMVSFSQSDLTSNTDMMHLSDVVSNDGHRLFPVSEGNAAITMHEERNSPPNGNPTASNNIETSNSILVSTSIISQGSASTQAGTSHHTASNSRAIVQTSRFVAETSTKTSANSQDSVSTQDRTSNGSDAVSIWTIAHCAPIFITRSPDIHTKRNRPDIKQSADNKSDRTISEKQDENVRGIMVAPTNHDNSGFYI